MNDLRQLAGFIQLSVAPIFLLTAVSSTLVVLLGRLARIVDRGRALEKLPDAKAAELELLERRAKLIYRAIWLGVSAALGVSLLMTAVFAGALFTVPFEAAKPLAFFFMAALFCFTGSLLCLLREVFLALGSFRLGLRAAK